MIPTRGFNGLIDALIDNDEYRQNFGNDIVPYQRRRYKGVPLIWLTCATVDWRDQSYAPYKVVPSIKPDARRRY